ncbi:MAG: hypothetical protein ACRD0F_07325, partial [Acidimicrobiales bacterium]
VRLALRAGEFGVVGGRGPVADPGQLDVEAAAAAGGRATGAVRNATPWALDDVAVVIGDAGALVGRLDPGEQRAFTVDAPVVDPEGQSTLSRLWRQGPRFFGEAGDGLPSLGTWDAARALGGVPAVEPGTAVAVGWTRGYEPPVVASGGRSTRGRTAVVGRAPVGGGAADRSLAVRREVVRGDDGASISGPGFGGSTVYRFVLPDGAPGAGGLVLRSDDLSQALEVWAPGGWRVLRAGAGGPNVQGRGFPVPVPVFPGAIPPPVGVAPPFGPATTVAPNPAVGGAALGAGAEVAVPAEALVGGQVFVRTTLSFQRPVLFEARP